MLRFVKCKKPRGKGKIESGAKDRSRKGAVPAAIPDLRSQENWPRGRLASNIVGYKRLHGSVRRE